MWPGLLCSQCHWQLRSLLCTEAALSLQKFSLPRRHEERGKRAGDVMKMTAHKVTAGIQRRKAELLSLGSAHQETGFAWVFRALLSLSGSEAAKALEKCEYL